MASALVLASSSQIRADLLRRAGVSVDVQPSRVDESAIHDSLQAEGAAPRDVADTLAEAKARRVAGKGFENWVLGCDQVLALGRDIMTKPETASDAERQLAALSGKRHSLFAAAVVYDRQQPIWRHVGVAHLTMRSLSKEFISDYVERNWEAIQHSVGCYRIEEEGTRLMSRIDGDYFSVLGLPLIELLSFMTARGKLPT